MPPFVEFHIKSDAFIAQFIHIFTIHVIKELHPTESHDVRLCSFFLPKPPNTEPCVSVPVGIASVGAYNEAFSHCSQAPRVSPPPQNHLPAGIKPCTAARTQASARGGQGHIVASDCGAPCVGWRFTSNTRSIDAGWKDNGWKGLVMHAIQRHLIFTCFLFLLCTQKKNVNAPRESACHPKWGCN